MNDQNLLSEFNFENVGIIFWNFLVDEATKILRSGPQMITAIERGVIKKGKTNHMFLQALVDADIIKADGPIGRRNTVYTLKNWKPPKEETDESKIYCLFPFKGEKVTISPKEISCSFNAGESMTIGSDILNERNRK